MQSRGHIVGLNHINDTSTRTNKKNWQKQLMHWLRLIKNWQKSLNCETTKSMKIIAITRAHHGPTRSRTTQKRGQNHSNRKKNQKKKSMQSRRHTKYINIYSSKTKIAQLKASYKTKDFPYSLIACLLLACLLPGGKRK